MRLYITALNPTDSVTDGFIPAARALGCQVTVLTDQPWAHMTAYDLFGDVEVLSCRPRDFRAVIDVIAHHHPADAVFTNSDHLQAPTALAAEYLGLPGKDWRAATTCKNKALTRRRLAAAGVESVHAVRLAPDDPVTYPGPYPAVVKPREGVASEDVLLVGGDDELRAAVTAIRARRPADALVVEEYLPGELHTLETLGDGRTMWALGGFRTTLSPPPHFIEERLDWRNEEPQEHVLAALRALGVGFGACHTEYAMTGAGPRIVEVNYRMIGDHCDFLLGDLLGLSVFERDLRLYLGEPLPAEGPPAPRGHAVVESVVASRPGTVVAAPPPVADARSPAGDVRLWHRPLRAPGDQITINRTNRDYLGIIRAIGPDQAATDAAVAGFRDANPWTIE
ncbi:ATP-grasp domain-containing protein [Rhizohabitans arisaemae]|uniref:ATP-grasp domain-containing protein n=1 Tax=Rhizohabitans arisaemae TaxID=2720610 RepID=UPI0024B1AA1D|nr:siderophore biosynthesis protein [Rhizohabitans arisaemae]